MPGSPLPPGSPGVGSPIIVGSPIPGSPGLGSPLPPPGLFESLNNYTGLASPTTGTGAGAIEALGQQVCQ